jgi:hypothetical protein
MPLTLLYTIFIYYLGMIFKRTLEQNIAQKHLMEKHEFILFPQPISDNLTSKSNDAAAPPELPRPPNIRH